MPSPKSVHPYKYNPVSPNGYPMCNNGFGYPVLDFLGSDPRSNQSYNQDIGNIASGTPAGFASYPGIGSGRYMQPFIHNMPHAYKLTVLDDNYYLKDRPWNMWWLSGTHILNRITLQEFSKIGGGQTGDGFAIVYTGVMAKYKYNKFVLPPGTPIDPTDPSQSFENPGLNTTDKITWFSAPKSGAGADQPDLPAGQPWNITFYLGFNVHQEDIENVGTNFPGEWQLWTSYNNYIYALNDLSFKNQYIIYYSGYYPEGDGVNPNQASTGLAFRPYSENVFHHPKVNIGDPADNLWWPSTVRINPYHG